MLMVEYIFTYISSSRISPSITKILTKLEGMIQKEVHPCLGEEESKGGNIATCSWQM